MNRTLEDLGLIVSEDGKVFRARDGREYKLQNNKGYMQCHPIINGKRTSILAHRLVARAFLDTPENWRALDVNHIDGNKGNNHYTNLEWVTKKQNQEHAYRTGLFKKKQRETLERRRMLTRERGRRFRARKKLLQEAA